MMVSLLWHCHRGIHPAAAARVGGWRSDACSGAQSSITKIGAQGSRARSGRQWPPRIRRQQCCQREQFLPSRRRPHTGQLVHCGDVTAQCALRGEHPCMHIVPGVCFMGHYRQPNMKRCIHWCTYVVHLQQGMAPEPLGQSEVAGQVKARGHTS